LLNDLVDQKDYTSLKGRLKTDRRGIQQTEERRRRPAAQQTTERKRSPKYSHTAKV